MHQTRPFHVLFWSTFSNLASFTFKNQEWLPFHVPHGALSIASNNCTKVDTTIHNPIPKQRFQQMDFVVYWLKTTVYQAKLHLRLSAINTNTGWLAHLAQNYCSPATSHFYKPCSQSLLRLPYHTLRNFSTKSPTASPTKWSAHLISYKESKNLGTIYSMPKFIIRCVVLHPH